MVNRVRHATKRFQFDAENHDAFTDDAGDLAKVRALNPDLESFETWLSNHRDELKPTQN